VLLDGTYVFAEREKVTIDSYIVRLEQQLQSLESQVIELLNTSTIERYPDNDYGPFYEPAIIALINTYYWGEGNESQKYLQLKLLRSYSSWFEQFQLLFYDSPQDIQKQINQTHTAVKKWIEKESGWNVPSTIEEAKALFKEQFQTYYQMLQIFKTSGQMRVILVPDTNALIICPDVSRYGAAVEQTTYTVVIVTTVLSELDKLKRDHRDIEFRNKVQAVIRRLKGLFHQGDIHEGVTVNKTVTVKTTAQGPDFTKTLSWLDPENNDDRIIAAALEVQREEPSSIVVLITADINHQNKARRAKLPYIEPPDTEKP